VTEYLERDENYEPAVLPSPAELLHWGEVNAPPGAPPSGSALPRDDEGVGFARFVSKPSPARIAVACVVSAIGVGVAAWGIGGLASPSGAAGIGVFFADVLLVVVPIAVLWATWKWARRPRSTRPDVPRPSADDAAEE
jgi:hypothetical protein